MSLRLFALPHRSATRLLWTIVSLVCLATCEAQDGVQVEGEVVAKILIGIFGAVASGLVAAILVSLGLVIFRVNHGPVGVSKKKQHSREIRSSASKALHMDGKETRFVSVYNRPSSGTASIIDTQTERSTSNSNLLLDSSRLTTSHPIDQSTRPPPTAPVPQARYQPPRLDTRVRPTAPLYPSLGQQVPVRSYGLRPGVHRPHTPSYFPNRDSSRPLIVPGRPVAYLNSIAEEVDCTYRNTNIHQTFPPPAFPPPPPSMRVHHPQFQHPRLYPNINSWY